MNRKWKVYVIQHSHTDIGYTERQEKIERYHADFIKQAIDILDEMHAEGSTDHFVWQCENQWGVEAFFRLADEKYKKSFVKYVNSGEIGLSGNYLNMTELVSETALSAALGRAQKFGREIGHPITAGMCADVNGMAWGYAKLLTDHGVRDFFTCINATHGTCPLYKRQTQFFWEAPDGERLFVWNGEHYNYGNALFLSPHAGMAYMIGDEFNDRIAREALLTDNAEKTSESELMIAKERVKRYLDALENAGYKYSLVPLMVSGAATDNSPPNREIAYRMTELNREFGGEVIFRMATLEEFFAEAERECADAPVFRGDWTDWWADGVGSTPAATKLYRSAVRKTELCSLLDKNGENTDKNLSDRSIYCQNLYAEHTWGYSSSVSESWDPMVSTLEERKKAYAADADCHISMVLDGILAARGAESVRQDREKLFKVINPRGFDICDTAKLELEYWEYVDGAAFDPSVSIMVTDADSGEICPHQLSRTSRSYRIEVPLFMRAGEEKILKISRSETAYKSHTDDAFEISANIIETEFFKISFDKRGISSLLYKPNGRELIRKDAEEGSGDVDSAFAGIYEITEAGGDYCGARSRMGMRRKCEATKRYVSEAENIAVIENGDVSATVKLTCRLYGTTRYIVLVKAYKHIPKIDVAVRFHKTDCLDPENVYVSLPFTAGDESVTYFDKTGCVIRPGIDQLPGTCRDFYSVQTGAVWAYRDLSVAVGTTDSPLLTLGKMASLPVVLCDGEDFAHNREHVYSWVMNNFWETNFKASLGGSYEFSYTISADCGKAPSEMLERCRAGAGGFVSFPTNVGM